MRFNYQYGPLPAGEYNDGSGIRDIIAVTDQFRVQPVGFQVLNDHLCFTAIAF